MRKDVIIVFMIMAIIMGCRENEIIYYDTSNIGKDRDVYFNYDVLIKEDRYYYVEIDEEDIIEYENEYEIEIGVEEIDDIWCWSPPDGSVVIDLKDAGIRDGYEYPDYGVIEHDKSCEGGSLDKVFEEEWDVDLQRVSDFYAGMGGGPGVAYFNGKSYVVRYGDCHEYFCNTHFIIINDKGEVEHYYNIYSQYSSPVIDDNGDVYFTTSFGELIVYFKYNEDIYLGRLASAGGGRSCFSTMKGLIAPVIGRDGTVYAILQCDSWGSGTTEDGAPTRGETYIKLVAVRNYQKLWEIEGKGWNIFGGDEYIDYLAPLMISPDDKLIISVNNRGGSSRCMDDYYGKIIYMDSEGRRVRETPWIKNGDRVRAYNTLDTFFNGSYIMKENGEIVGRIREDGVIPVTIITDRYGGGITFKEENVCKMVGSELKCSERYTQLVRVDGNGNITNRYKFPDNVILPERVSISWSVNMQYLNNDGVLLSFYKSESNMIRVYIFDKELNPIWYEDLDIGKDYATEHYLFSPECGKLLLLKHRDSSTYEKVLYQFRISDGIGPGRSPWPMWRGDPQNTGRVQVYK